jgi:drug/metabolite transporter (DMT)-like permease
MAYVLALAAAVAYGAADFMGGLASRRAATLAVVLWSQLVGLAMVAAAVLVFPAHPTARDLAWGAAAGLAGSLGVGLLYYALSIAPMSVVAPITGVCALSVPVVAGLAFGERPGAAALAGVPLAALAVVLVSRGADPAHAPPSARGSGLGVPIAVAAGVVVGLFLVGIAQVSPRAGLWPLVAARASSVAAGGVIGAAGLHRLRLDRGTVPVVVAAGAVDMVANILYLLAVQRGMLSLVGTLSSLYPGATVLLAALVLHERLRPVQLAGLACALAAVVLVTA